MDAAFTWADAEHRNEVVKRQYVGAMPKGKLVFFLVCFRRYGSVAISRYGGLEGWKGGKVGVSVVREAVSWEFDSGSPVGSASPV